MYQEVSLFSSWRVFFLVLSFVLHLGLRLSGPVVKKYIRRTSK
jgi:hypothetical protein